MSIVGQILSIGRWDMIAFGLYFGRGILTTITNTKIVEATKGRHTLIVANVN